MTATGAGTGTGLEVADLRVVFDGFVAVDGVSFSVAPGESFGIVGESGSGKSTVLRALCSLAPRTAGSVRLTGASGAIANPGCVRSSACTWLVAEALVARGAQVESPATSLMCSASRRRLKRYCRWGFDAPG